jgi:hypothetical protein
MLKPYVLHFGDSLSVHNKKARPQRERAWMFSLIFG